MNTIDDAKLREIVERVLSQVMGSPQKSAPAIPTQPGKSDTAADSSQTGKGSKKLVILGADHGGFELKETVKTFVAELGYDVQDIGTYTKNPVDYPDFAHEVASRVAAGKAWRGIMIDGAGIGSCIVANKVPGVRAGMAYDLSSASNSREHNDTNVLTLGAGLIGLNLAKQIVKTWLSTEFGGGRHQPRIDKIVAVEKKYLK
ncbi:MAG TPA: ribose 5-phosphate isomerase B [Anaerolineales bacterium]|nr:ribose 5-phosphate isomerase B [Anaerolineales bacterium]